MKWVIDFYNRRRAIFARYEVDAPSAVTASADLILGGSTLAHADVPKPQDIAACNHEAQDRSCMRKAGF